MKSGGGAFIEDNPGRDCRMLFEGYGQGQPIASQAR